MGSGTDYSSSIKQGLDQANQPKSNLSQEYSGLLGGIAPGILHSLLNTQNLGNSFLNVNGASSQNGNQNMGGQGSMNQGWNPLNPNNKFSNPMFGDAGNPVIPQGQQLDIGGSGLDGGTGDGQGENQTGIVNNNGSNGFDPGGGGLNYWFGQGQGLSQGGATLPYQGIGKGNQNGININGFQSANPQLASMFGLDQYSDPRSAIAQLFQGVGNNPQQVGINGVGPSQFQQQQANPGMIYNPGSQLTQGTSDSFNSIAKILNQQSAQGLADQHERFTGIGGARSTGASLADAQFKAQMMPQLAEALNAASNNAANQQMGFNQQNIGVQGQNISNMLNAAGINNQFGLGNAQLNANIGQGNQGANLQAQGMNQNAGLQNQGQNNNLLAQLLGQQGQNVNNTNSANLGMNSILQALAQSNSSGANAFNLGVGGMNQQAGLQQQSQAQNALMALFGMGGSLAGAGIPGGSANINLGNNQQGSGLGAGLQGIGSILAAFG